MKEKIIIVLIGIIFGIFFKISSLYEEYTILIILIIEDYILYEIYLKRKINMKFEYYSIIGIGISFIVYVCLVWIIK